MINTEGYRRK